MVHSWRRATKSEPCNKLLPHFDKVSTRQTCLSERFSDFPFTFSSMFQDDHLPTNQQRHYQSISSTWYSIYTAFVCSVILLCAATLHIESRQITSNAFSGGHDIDGAKLFICRSHKYGQIIPGKYSQTIGKCSVTHNRREAQFHRYEILEQSADKHYEWIRLKKPVTHLPANVLFGGNQFGITKRVSASNANISALLDSNGQLNNHSVDLLLSSDHLWGSRKRRVRRSATQTQVPNEAPHWSRNWRGHLYEGVERIRSFTRKTLKTLGSNSPKNFTEIPVDRRKCAPKAETPFMPESNCTSELQKANFYIAKCTLRTGDITSEQIGKIWWNDAIMPPEWTASFPFAGHEVYCLDYEVLTLKN